MATAQKQPAPIAISPALFTRCVVHVLGREPGKALCGAPLPGASANPVHELWGDAGERRRAVGALSVAMRASLRAFPGEVEVCRGCAGNVARKAAASSRKDGGKKTQKGRTE